jgi:epoxyqueuosine reductase
VNVVEFDATALKEEIGQWGAALGFARLGVAAIALPEDEARLAAWVAAGRHGEMDYMARHGTKRSRPAELVPGTVCVISATLPYLDPDARDMHETLADGSAAYVSRYALGRDYHKVLRARLKTLAERIGTRIGQFGYRVFTDSAPVLEKALARNAGLGWIGKHTNLIHRHDGSWFFVGEIYTDLPLPPDPPFRSNHCGTCVRCIDACPTAAIVAPYELDARRCISYLTIEYGGVIPEEFRPLMGNRIYGCDDCQLVCPWNRYARKSVERDFETRHGLDRRSLLELWDWDEGTFLKLTEGSAIRRVGFAVWQRNLAVALGNAPRDPAIAAALARRLDAGVAPLVAEHIAWALAQQARREARERT